MQEIKAGGAVAIPLQSIVPGQFENSFAREQDLLQDSHRTLHPQPCRSPPHLPSFVLAFPKVSTSLSPPILPIEIRNRPLTWPFPVYRALVFGEIDAPVTADRATTRRSRTLRHPSASLQSARIPPSPEPPPRKGSAQISRLTLPFSSSVPHPISDISQCLALEEFPCL